MPVRCHQLQNIMLCVDANRKHVQLFTDKYIPLIPFQNHAEESDLQQRVSTKTVDLQEQFPAVLKYLEEIMNETILSERHKNFMTGKRERKGYLFGARLVSIELKNTLHNMLDAHSKTKKTLTQGPVDHSV
ncbi:uncharacterized protein [Apostichopus japonicus]|uniref:uncharacterized protein isoform X2 n=2 Tax=Stichopus japonicus TaxID=307972 RepID=UPI003AB50004